MLDEKAPMSKLGPPSRGSSFYIENLLGTNKDRVAPASEERVETTGKVSAHSPVMCPGRVDDSEVPTWRETSVTTVYGSCGSECPPACACVFVFVCILNVWFWTRTCYLITTRSIPFGLCEITALISGLSGLRSV